MQPGDVVELRSVFRGRVRWAFPHTLVADGGEQIALYLEPGARGVQIGRGDGHLLRWARGDPPHPHTWHSRRALKLIRRGDAHSLELHWDDFWRFEGWYVNLQAPLTECAAGFDTTDRALDIVVAPDGAWRWENEDDLAELVLLGAFTAEEAAAIRAEGERVIAAKPWPTGWEDWRP